jgi:small subunit ribosomal protein S16
MLAIRMQRTGRSGHAQFRVIVQDARAHPKSGRVIEYLGNYNPHSKIASINTDKISEYLNNGAQPSERVVKLLKKEGVKMPKWVVAERKKEKSVRNPEKLRRNRPAGEPEPEKTPIDDEAGKEAPVESGAEEATVPAESPEVPEEQNTPETEAEPVADTPDEPAASPQPATEPDEPAEQPKES